MKRFSALVLQHAREATQRGELENPSGEGWAGSRGAGRYVRMQVHVRAGRVEAARFQTYGCAPSIACANYLAEWAVGRTVAEVQALEAEELELALGGLPPSRKVCAELAVHAMRRALEQA